MTELERYVRRATLGLPGRRRRLVQDELRANILHHALDLQLGGLGEPEALQRALRDLGSPVRLRLGLLRVHTLPVALTALLLTSGVGTVAYGLSLTDAGAAPVACGAPHDTGAPCAAPPEREPHAGR